MGTIWTQDTFHLTQLIANNIHSILENKRTCLPPHNVVCRQLCVCVASAAWRVIRGITAFTVTLVSLQVTGLFVEVPTRSLYLGVAVFTPALQPRNSVGPAGRLCGAQGMLPLDKPPPAGSLAGVFEGRWVWERSLTFSPPAPAFPPREKKNPGYTVAAVCKEPEHVCWTWHMHMWAPYLRPALSGSVGTLNSVPSKHFLIWFKCHIYKVLPFLWTCWLLGTSKQQNSKNYE